MFGEILSHSFIWSNKNNSDIHILLHNLLKFIELFISSNLMGEAMGEDEDSSLETGDECALLQKRSDLF